MKTVAKKLLSPVAHHARARQMATGAPDVPFPWGVVLDIDGVLVRGPHVIPGAVQAVRMLREAAVPYVFMTNGGGMTEAMKAASLAKLLEDETIDASRVVLAHTPMRPLANRYRGRRVVIAGSRDFVGVARSYGFDVDGGMAVTPAQIMAGTPAIFSRQLRLDTALPPIDVNADGIPIEAIIMLSNMNDWGGELQVLSDVLAGGWPLGSGHVCEASGMLTQSVQVFSANPDFVYPSDYPAPRYTQGAFMECLRALWRRRSGGAELEVTEFGKPHQVQFRVAEEVLANLASRKDAASQARLKRIYMVGDNPASDVRGANDAGGVWRSVLVCTGVYQGASNSNDLEDPAWCVERDLLCAVERLLNSHN